MKKLVVLIGALFLVASAMATSTCITNFTVSYVGPSCGDACCEVSNRECAGGSYGYVFNSAALASSNCEFPIPTGSVFSMNKVACSSNCGGNMLKVDIWCTGNPGNPATFYVSLAYNHIYEKVELYAYCNGSGACQISWCVLESTDCF